jgi:hypothetical protein
MANRARSIELAGEAARIAMPHAVMAAVIEASASKAA